MGIVLNSLVKMETFPSVLKRTDMASEQVVYVLLSTLEKKTIQISTLDEIPRHPCTKSIPLPRHNKGGEGLLPPRLATRRNWRRC